MNRLIAVCVLLAVVGCGGGSNPPESILSANTPPIISDPGDVAVTEGELTVTTISASDSDGDSLSYSLSGEDSALFAISNAGVLRFLKPADYSAPADANRDNIYSFSVSVADGEATSKLEVSVTVVKKLTDFEQGIFQDPSVYQNLCGDPRKGTDPFSGAAYPDKQGSFADENNWLRAISHDRYLWYDEIADVDPYAYASSAYQVREYFGLMKTSATTSSGKKKDQYHSAVDSLKQKQFDQFGVKSGYGVTWSVVQQAPPRKVVVAFVEPNSPASTVGLSRGAMIIAADGVDMVNDRDTATLNTALYPPTAGQSHSFEVLDQGSTRPHSITMTPTEITKDPVPHVSVINTSSGLVGYLIFNDHTTKAEQALINAVIWLRDRNITDLVLDLRYNGGGAAEIASQLAYMVAGPNATSGRTFLSQQANNKHPATDPNTKETLAPMPFLTTASGKYSAEKGTAFPYLNLDRVYVLTSSKTCSASEAVINGLRGVDIEVIQIGSTTCGKPYAVYPWENCGTTYLPIQYQIVNSKGFGNYTDGFSPSNLTTVEGEPVPGCSVNDDFSKALGDPSEAMLSAALAYHADPGTCPALPNRLARRAQAPTSVMGLGSHQQLDRITPPAFPGGLLFLPQPDHN